MKNVKCSILGGFVGAFLVFSNFPANATNSTGQVSLPPSSGSNVVEMLLAICSGGGIYAGGSKLLGKKSHNEGEEPTLNPVFDYQRSPQYLQDKFASLEEDHKKLIIKMESLRRRYRYMENRFVKHHDDYVPYDERISPKATSSE